MKNQEIRTKDIMLSSWCTMCEERGQYIYRGQSLCPEHFEQLKQEDSN